MDKRSVIQKLKGFTLLELIFTMSITAITLIIGIPAFQDFGMSQRMSATINSLHSHLSLARNQAIRFNAHVIACPGTQSSGCLNEGDWSDGWIVFSDFNGDRDFQVAESLHRVEPGIEQVFIHSSSGRQYLRFYPNGSAPGSNGSITFCDRRGPSKARKLVISNLGRIRRDQALNLNEKFCPVENG
jgi:type IV fimbrial biogenesis protein FimT